MRKRAWDLEMTRRDSKVAGAVGLLILFTATGAALLWGTGSQQFPHARHASLFPTCLGCHAGVPEGDAADTYSVTPGFCAGCHDGRARPEVAWTGPTPVPGNLAFSHTEHPQLECAVCHGSPGTDPLEIERAVVPTCLGCHAPGAEGHQAAGVPCAQCHLPLAEAAELPAERIAAFPIPDDHAAEDYIAAHGELAEADAARCTVCHARESCTRCHVNAEDVPVIRDLPADPRVAELMAGRPGEWPIPESHASADWRFSHGVAAEESIASCSNCHVKESCAGCHGAATDRIAAGLPDRRPGGPAGAQVAVVRPPGHTPGFSSEHGTAAALGLPECSSCHTESYCSDCHDGPTAPGLAGRSAAGPSLQSAAGFHPANFVVRHGAETYAGLTECGSCHSTEVFCRDCHQQLGIGQGAITTSGAFHDAQPLWLLSHGRAARQGLESCASCHAQQSCLRCHSAKVGWRVNPHGSDFDAERLKDRSTMSCGICHFGFQLLDP